MLKIKWILFSETTETKGLNQSVVSNNPTQIFYLLCGTKDLNKGDLLTRSPLIPGSLMSVQILTPPRTPLLGNVDPLLVCFRFGMPQLR